MTAVIGIGALAVVGWLTATNLASKPDTGGDPMALKVSHNPESAHGLAALEREPIASQIVLAEKTPAPSDPEPRANRAEPSPRAYAADTGPHPEPATLELDWREYEVKRGDSLARIFKQQNLSTAEAIRIADHPDAKEISTLMPGQKMRFGFDGDARLRAVGFELSAHRSLIVRLGEDGSLRFNEKKAELEKREAITSAFIESSLFKAGYSVGLRDKVILELVAIFGWDIDFALDLRKGDHFTVVYEEFHDGDTSKGVGDILAAVFVNRDRKLSAFRHVDDQGRVAYFDAEGQSMRGTFLRTPVKISRITSGFSKRRLHPVLKKWRAHKGVDYGAPRGTPVLATADGKVSFLGTKNGYGKTIILRHGGQFSTLYAHLSSYKSTIRPGTSVKQGQTIGFVGKTGLATAPHLHYEFRVRGEHRDPLKYKSPKADPVAEQERERFLAAARHWMDVIARYNGVQLAQNDAGA